jgi:hypothetical protein
VTLRPPPLASPVVLLTVLSSYDNPFVELEANF